MTKTESKRARHSETTQKKTQKWSKSWYPTQQNQRKLDTQRQSREKTQKQPKLLYFTHWHTVNAILRLLIVDFLFFYHHILLIAIFLAVPDCLSYAACCFYFSIILLSWFSTIIFLTIFNCLFYAACCLHYDILFTAIIIYTQSISFFFLYLFIFFFFIFSP